MSDATPTKKAAARYVGVVDEVELAIRMAEAAIGVRRPKGMTQQEILNSFPGDWGEAFHRAARAAMDYWAECFARANRVS